MIIYTCPKCGGDLQHYCIATYPLTYMYKCVRCHWQHEKQDEIVRVPFEPVKAKLDEDWTTYEALDNVMTNG